MSYSYGGFETLEYQSIKSTMVIYINRPKVFNALNSKVFSELYDIFKKIEEDDSIKVVVLTGKGEKSFIAGSDVSEMVGLTPSEGNTFALTVYKTQQKIATFLKPTIASINGFAFGGGLEIAMCCDLRIASEKAKFGQPELDVGLIPGGGGTQRLQRIVGQGIAKEMIFTCMVLDAVEAHRIGLVNRVVQHEKLMDETLALAKEISLKSSVLIQFAKTAINTGADMDLENALKNEIKFFLQCFATHDGLEGMTAFVEKRKPEFIGN